jgi:hypothetical protein
MNARAYAKFRSLDAAQRRSRTLVGEARRGAALFAALAASALLTGGAFAREPVDRDLRADAREHRQAVTAEAAADARAADAQARRIEEACRERAKREGEEHDKRGACDREPRIGERDGRAR